MRVLALVPGGISNQLLFFPTLATVKQSYPNSEIDVVVEPRAKSAYGISPVVYKTIVFDFAANNSPADWANLLGVLRDPYYDVALCLSPDFSTGFCLWLTGIPQRIGYAGKGGQLFYTAKVPLQPKPYLPHQYHDLLQGLQITAPCPPLAITLSKPALDWATAEQERLGLQGQKYILIDGFRDGWIDGGGQVNPYPLESWQEIIRGLQAQQPDTPIVISQSLGAAAQIQQLVQQCPGIKVSRPPHLSELAALVGGAKVLLCMEGVALQLAVALQIQTLVLLGDGQSSQLLPQKDRSFILQAPQGDLSRISPQSVIDQVVAG